MRAIGVAAWAAAWVAVGVVAAGCDKKPEGTPGAATASASVSAASASASVAASASGSGSAEAHPGACKQLLAERTTRCDAMAKGDPTIESACKEAIDRLTSVGDDGRCWSAMNPPEAGPPQDDVPE
jgi:hypothetical protein